MKDAVIPIVWAREIPGKSKRAEPVRIKSGTDKTNKTKPISFKIKTLRRLTAYY